MRNVPHVDILTEALAAILADMEHAIAGLPRPPALIEAERQVVEAREHRADLFENWRGIIKKLTRAAHRSEADEAEVHRAKADLDKAEGLVTRGQQALSRQRDLHVARIAGAIEHHRASAAAALAGAAAIFSAGEAAAAREHRALPDAVPYSPAIDGMIVASYRTAAKQRAAADRQFDRAAAAMSARARPPAPPAGGKVKWKGKLSEYGVGSVDDAPVPISAGSGHTSQKLSVVGSGSFAGSGAVAVAATIFGRKRT